MEEKDIDYNMTGPYTFQEEWDKDNYPMFLSLPHHTLLACQRNLRERRREAMQPVEQGGNLKNTKEGGGKKKF